MEPPQAALERPTVVIQPSGSMKRYRTMGRSGAPCQAAPRGWEGPVRAARKHANQVHHASCRTERVVSLYKPT